MFTRSRKAYECGWISNNRAFVRLGARRITTGTAIICTSIAENWVGVC